MVAKFFVIFVLVATVTASDCSSFSYGVGDPFNGDYKNQIESRAGNSVQGQYSLLESDGTRRTVDYAAGAQVFNAIVSKDPTIFPTSPFGYAAPIYGYNYPYSYASFGRFGAFDYAAPYTYRRFF